MNYLEFYSFQLGFLAILLMAGLISLVFAVFFSEYLIKFKAWLDEEEDTYL